MKEIQVVILYMHNLKGFKYVDVEYDLYEILSRIGKKIQKQQQRKKVGN